MGNETVADVADLALLREILGVSPAARMLIELETLRADKAANAREVEALRLRAEAAEARLWKVREIAARMTSEAMPATNSGLTMFVPFYQLAALRDAAIASGGEDRK